MNSILITGGSGFFGRILSRWLAERGFQCTNIDLLVHNEQDTPNIRHVQIDVTDAVQVNRVFKNHHFDAVIHCAAMLPLSDTSKTSLWKTNVQGTCNIAQAAADHAVKKLVFTSTSCLWGQPMGRPVTEADTPHPVDIYGESKWEAEKCLEQFRGRFDYVILRIPLIVDAGRMGLLAILFEFIEEGRSVWVVGRGRNRYHFVLASDLAHACECSLNYHGSGVFNVGSDDVKPMREVYQSVIQQANSSSQVRSLPRSLTLVAMRLCYMLGISPLGAYHRRLIADDFIFDTTHIKNTLGWAPTATNEQMLFRAYEYYLAHRHVIHNLHSNSTTCQPAKMGIIRLLKWIS